MQNERTECPQPFVSAAHVRLHYLMTTPLPEVHGVIIGYLKEHVGTDCPARPRDSGARVSPRATRSVPAAHFHRLFAF